jgi:hypothetical protein
MYPVSKNTHLISRQFEGLIGLSKASRNQKDHYFLRLESFYIVATYMDQTGYSVITVPTLRFDVTRAEAASACAYPTTLGTSTEMFIGQAFTQKMLEKERKIARDANSAILALIQIILLK